MREVFNELHKQLSVEHNEVYSPWELYKSLSDCGFDPDNLEPKEASRWCRLYGHLEVANRIRRFNTKYETPETILNRIINAFTK